MRNLTQGFDGGRPERQLPDPAVSAFLYLGRQLGSYQAREAASGSPSALPAETARSLLRAIEGEIIPRLLLAHRAREATPPPPRAVPLEERDHARFLEIVMHGSADSTHRFVDDLLLRGVPHETVFLDLLSHAARRLGELWEEDRCDFSDVTIGLCRLHEVLREHSVVHDARRHRGVGEMPRILLATACADQHVFGVVLVAEFFRRAGWRVWSEPGAFRWQLAALLAEQDFDVLGLSASRGVCPEDVCNEIEMLRKASCNTELRVLVGGRLFLETPDLVGRVGADGSASDARTAPAAANDLLARPGLPCD